MDKRGDIHAGHTPDTEGKLRKGEKTGAKGAAEEALDDDAFHRLADKAADAHAPQHKRPAQ